jgi:hypothetical protein
MQREAEFEPHKSGDASQQPNLSFEIIHTFIIRARYSWSVGKTYAAVSRAGLLNFCGIFDYFHFVFERLQATERVSLIDLNAIVQCFVVENVQSHIS